MIPRSKERGKMAGPWTAGVMRQRQGKDRVAPTMASRRQHPGREVAHTPVAAGPCW